jgi:hypothetical protein
LTLHFAYGSNMSRDLMRARCPGATALGVAILAGWRFIINPDGYGSIARQPGGRVYVVLWRLTPRDLSAVNAYENLDAGRYRRRVLPVEYGARQRSALVYIGCRQGLGRARPGYVRLVIAAARDWRLPVRYTRSLERWSPSCWAGPAFCLWLPREIG